jgi:ankyrin repeat protein
MLEAIFDAIIDHNLEALQNLLRSDPGLVDARNEHHWTPLHQACGSCNLVAAKLLLENGAQVNARGGAEETPLHLADSIELSRLLLLYGADPRISDRNGMTTMSFAKAEKNWALLERLQGAVTELEKLEESRHKSSRN